MSRIRANVEINVNHERWLVSYADFITLLFAFFVVMYSVSKVDQEKQQILSQTLLKVFNQPEKTLKPIQVGNPVVATVPSIIEVDNSELSNVGVGVFPEASQLPSANSQIASGPIAGASLDRQFATLEAQLRNRFSELVENNQLYFKNTQHWLEIELKTTQFFESGSAEPNFAAETTFDEIGQSLAPYPNRISIEGHTDNLPISTSTFPSNWELSAARASTVVQIFAENGVSQPLMTAVGHGSHKPIADNSTEQNQALNRRIVIRVEKQADKTDSDGIYETQKFYRQKNEILSRKDFSAREKNQAIIDLGEPPHHSALIQVLDILTDTQVSTERTVSPDVTIPGIVLDNGNLLFSSDPDLPRN